MSATAPEVIEGAPRLIATWKLADVLGVHFTLAYRLLRRGEFSIVAAPEYPGKRYVPETEIQEYRERANAWLTRFGKNARPLVAANIAKAAGLDRRAKDRNAKRDTKRGVKRDTKRGVKRDTKRGVKRDT